MEGGNLLSGGTGMSRDFPRTWTVVVMSKYRQEYRRRILLCPSDVAEILLK